MVDKVEMTDSSILLRPYQMSDADPLHQAIRESAAELSKWFPWCRAEPLFEESQAFLARTRNAWGQGRDYSLAVIDAKGGGYLGGCSIFEVRPGDKTASASYWVRTTRTGEGIATAAMHLLAEFGFGQLKLNRIEIIVATENKPSLRVAEKSRAKREGVLRNRFPVGNRIYGAVMFSLIPADMP